jgi:hypothetical protein
MIGRKQEKIVKNYAVEEHDLKVFLKLKNYFQYFNNGLQANQYSFKQIDHSISMDALFMLDHFGS